ncbi:MAG: hypothetical protein C0624_04245 [Desulfuromonas sp.]|nr:MAG: hypothetical protein C0624_04245 [Desulfuromonas sp.]
MLLYQRFLMTVVGLLAAIVALLWWAEVQQRTAEVNLQPLRGELVRRLTLTDLALWSEARYTRHPSQADLFTPFQEFPGSLEHFPAGSLIAPPPRRAKTTLEVRREDSTR